MITSQYIGYNGRFANQMFQLAAMMSLAEKKGCEFGIPKWNVESNGFYLQEAFDIPQSWFKDVDCSSYPIDREWHYSDEFFNLPNDVNLHSYYQDERFFKHIEFKVRKLFQFRPHIVKKCKGILDAVSGTTVGVHVRRTDYLDEKYKTIFKTIPLAYYERARKMFEMPHTLVICSDDVEWCKQHFNGNVVFSEGNVSYEDMCLMSMCDHNIIANSSFSWWAAYLNQNPNKIVVMPSLWFAPDQGECSYSKALQVEGWKLVDSSDTPAP